MTAEIILIYALFNTKIGCCKMFSMQYSKISFPFITTQTDLFIVKKALNTKFQAAFGWQEDFFYYPKNFQSFNFYM